MAQSKTEFISNPFVVTFRGFNKLFHHNQTIAWVLLIIGIFLSGSQTASNFRQQPKGVETSPAADFPTILGMIIGIALVTFTIGLLIGTVVNGILSFIAWKTSRQESTTFSEALRATMDNFGTLLQTTLFVWLKILVGLLLFVIPGIRAVLRYQMVYFPIFEDGLNPKQAMARMDRLTKNHLLEIFGMVAVGSVIPVIGILLQMGGQVVMYPQLVAAKKEKLKTKPHWLNYLALGLFIAMLIFLAWLSMYLSRNST